MAFTRAGALEYLSRAYERGRLAHSYLISGPPGSGKRGLASDLSNLVTSAVAADVFASQPPGVYLAEPESKSRRIVIDQVRALEHVQEHLVDRLKILFEQSPLRHGSPVVGYLS